jgi:hypothetical protein
MHGCTTSIYTDCQLLYIVSYSTDVWSLVWSYSDKTRWHLTPATLFSRTKQEGGESYYEVESVPIVVCVDSGVHAMVNISVYTRNVLPPGMITVGSILIIDPTLILPMLFTRLAYAITYSSDAYSNSLYYPASFRRSP